MGRLVPGLPGILQCTSPNAPPHPPTHLLSLSPRHSPSPTPPTWKSLLHFPLISPFSLVLTQGGPLYSPLHARSQRCDRSPGPCAGFPSPLCLPWLPAFPTALLYWFTPPTNAVCLCFAPLAPRSLIFITLPFSSFSLFPSLISSFSCPLLSNHRQGKKTWQDMRGGGKKRWKDGSVGGETRPLIFH